MRDLGYDVQGASCNPYVLIELHTPIVTKMLGCGGSPTAARARNNQNILFKTIKNLKSTFTYHIPIPLQNNQSMIPVNLTHCCVWVRTGKGGDRLDDRMGRAAGSRETTMYRLHQLSTARATEEWHAASAEAAPTATARLAARAREHPAEERRTPHERPAYHAYCSPPSATVPRPQRVSPSCRGGTRW